MLAIGKAVGGNLGERLVSSVIDCSEEQRCMAEFELARENIGAIVSRALSHLPCTHSAASAEKKLVMLSPSEIGVQQGSAFCQLKFVKMEDLEILERFRVAATTAEAFFHRARVKDLYGIREYLTEDFRKAFCKEAEERVKELALRHLGASVEDQKIFALRPQSDEVLSVGCYAVCEGIKIPVFKDLTFSQSQDVRIVEEYRRCLSLRTPEGMPYYTSRFGTHLDDWSGYFGTHLADSFIRESEDLIRKPLAGYHSVCARLVPENKIHLYGQKEGEEYASLDLITVTDEKLLKAMQAHRMDSLAGALAVFKRCKERGFDFRHVFTQVFIMSAGMMSKGYAKEVEKELIAMVNAIAHRKGNAMLAAAGLPEEVFERVWLNETNGVSVLRSGGQILELEQESFSEEEKSIIALYEACEVLVHVASDLPLFTKG